MAARTPIELPELADLDPVHFIAIGGSGMNGIASMMLDAGLTVSGSDRQDSKYLQALGERGARVHVGHRAEQLGDARTVVASSAIREDNPELALARARAAGAASQRRPRLADARSSRHRRGRHPRQDDHDGDAGPSADPARLRSVVRHRRCPDRHVDRRASRRRRGDGRRGRRERRLLPAVSGRGRGGDQRRPRSPEQLGQRRRTTPTASSASPPPTGSGCWWSAPTTRVPWR